MAKSKKFILSETTQKEYISLLPNGMERKDLVGLYQALLAALAAGQLTVNEDAFKSMPEDAQRFFKEVEQSSIIS